MRQVLRLSSAPGSPALSILYLRCVGHRQRAFDGRAGDAFNSLFEMPPRLRRETPSGGRTFNSLFEMQRGDTSKYDALVMRFAFNSLFEMPGSPGNCPRPAGDGPFNSLFEMPQDERRGVGEVSPSTLSILYLRCSNDHMIWSSLTHSLSILYLRCSSRIGSRMTKATILSILYLRCHSWDRRRQSSRAGLSILYLRCCGDVAHSHHHISVLSILYLRCY